MGISGLLPFLKRIHEQVNIAQFKGCTVAIDAYCWLHKGAFSCAEKLALKEDTDQYVFYCMKYVNYILAKDIKPILVFDGCHLESKAGVEKTRRERRELHRKKAAQFLREGKRNEAKDCLQKCIDITPQMALRLIQACRDKGVDCIVAPYEADAQLAYLNLSGIAQVIITEDSDLLLFGCDKVIFKMDFFGNGTLIQKSRLNEVLAVESGFYTFEKFRHMCILSGCDYLPSLPGIGLATANKVFKLARQGDIRLLLKKLSTYIKKNLTVTDEYVEGFIKAENTFLYQLVFDPMNRELKPINPYPPGLEWTDLGYAGHYIKRQMAYQIALGNIDIHTHEAMSYFDPDTFIPKNATNPQYRYQLSIWDKNYTVKSGSPCKEIQPSSLIDPADNNSIIARGRIVPKSRVIKLSDHHEHSTLMVTEIIDCYDPKVCSPKTVPKKRLFEDLDDYKEEKVSAKRGYFDNNLDKTDEIHFNDENDESSPLKQSPAKLRKFKYDASNIGEEAFKEDSKPQPKEESKPNSSNTHHPRNIFAVVKTAKSNLKVDSTAVTKSKYFNNGSKSTAVSKPAFHEESSKTLMTSSSLNVSNTASDRETPVTKKETPKPMSLKEMFKNLKDKKSEQGEESVNSDSVISPRETSKAKGSGNADEREQNRRSLSAFSWSKLKTNSSSKSNSKCVQLHQSNPSTSNSGKDSFSELLMKEAGSSVPRRSSHSIPPSPTATTSKLGNNQNLEEPITSRLHEELPTKMKLMSATTPDFDLKEIKSQSYESFLKSMTSSNEENSEGGPESKYDDESPFPQNKQNKNFTKVVDVNVVDMEDSALGSSGKDVVDLTLDDSQQSNVSRSSNASGRSQCRVSGLSKRKRQVKKIEKPKSDNNQKSIKDLFSKFAFKKESEPKVPIVSTTYSVETLDDSSDDGFSETPTSQSFSVSNVAAVRRQLML